MIPRLYSGIDRLQTKDVQFNLGVSYCNGEGVPQDSSESLRWLRSAHAQGYEAAAAIQQILQEQRQQAAAGPTPPPTPSPLPIGTRVELRFRSKPDLNGQRGVGHCIYDTPVMRIHDTYRHS